MIGGLATVAFLPDAAAFVGIRAGRLFGRLASEFTCAATNAREMSDFGLWADAVPDGHAV